MVTNPTEPEAPTTTREDVAAAIERLESGVSVLLTGRDVGGVRRNLLWVAAFALIIVGLPLVALIPLVLLALTDAVLV
jgi:hypothetical protein